MSLTSKPVSDALPAQIDELLKHLVQAACECFKEDLRSIILFGSGAEGRLRPTSDLNLLLVLKRFEKSRVDGFREPLRLAQVAARASAMFLLETELPVAAEAFAVKFEDIAKRHKVLYGENVLAGLATSRAARKQRLGQVLMNLTLRLRERYATTSLQEEQLVIVIAETAGPLRAAASTLCDLEGRPAGSPKAALEFVATSLGGSEWAGVMELITQARTLRSLPSGVAPAVVFQLIHLAEAMRSQTEKLS